MKTLSIDIETYSDKNLAKTGVYRYVESPVFEILLFSYSVDGGPVQLVDLACGEIIPADIISALEDDAVTKWAFNSNGNKGIACGLNNLQLIRPGEPLGGKASAESDFATDDDEDFLG